MQKRLFAFVAAAFSAGTKIVHRAVRFACAQAGALAQAQQRGFEIGERDRLAARRVRGLQPGAQRAWCAVFVFAFAQQIQVQRCGACRRMQRDFVGKLPDFAKGT